MSSLVRANGADLFVHSSFDCLSLILLQYGSIVAAVKASRWKNMAIYARLRRLGFVTFCKVREES